MPERGRAPNRSKVSHGILEICNLCCRPKKRSSSAPASERLHGTDTLNHMTPTHNFCLLLAKDYWHPFSSMFTQQSSRRSTSLGPFGPGGITILPYSISTHRMLQSSYGRYRMRPMPMGLSNPPEPITIDTTGYHSINQETPSPDRDLLLLKTPPCEGMGRSSRSPKRLALNLLDEIEGNYRTFHWSHSPGRGSTKEASRSPSPRACLHCVYRHGLGYLEVLLIYMSLSVMECCVS